MTLPEREYLSWLFRTIVEREDEIKQFHKTLDSVQRELAESRGLAAQEQLEKKRLQDKLLELEAQLNATAQCMRNEASELHAQARAIPSLRASLEMAQRQLEAKDGQCKNYEAMIEKLNFQYAENTQTKARIEELEQKLKEANARLSEYETQHQSDARRLLETMTERDQTQTTLEATNVQLSNASQRVQTLEKQNTDLSQSLVNLEGQARNKTQQVASLEKDLNSLKDRELKLAADCAALQSQLTTLHKKSSEMEKRLALTPEGSRSPLNANAHRSTSNGQPQAGLSTSQQANAAPAPEPPYHRIPQQRRHTLEAFAVITVPDFATGEVTFSRAELTAQLGGGLQGVDGKFGTPRKVAAAHGLTGCIYPQRQTNPWLPALPGQHGYMFLGLEGPAKDNMKFFEPTERALFIQEGPSCWRYYGLYVIQRHAGNDLSQEEWAQFDESFKDGRGSYSDTTLAKQLGKGYDNLVKNTPGEYRQRTAQIREEYDNGTRRVPCITLQCIGYNEQFFNDILACRPSERASLSAKRKRTPKQLPDGTESPSPTRPRLQ